MFNLMTASFGLLTRAFTKILGSQLLRGCIWFRHRSGLDVRRVPENAREQTYKILQAHETAFLVVAAPEPDAIREAAYFAGRLEKEKMPLAGLVLNRASRPPEGDLSADRASAGVERLRALGGTSPAAEMTAGLLRLHADRVRIVERETRLRRSFATSHPDVATAVLPALATDVHDLDGLRTIGDLLASQR